MTELVDGQSLVVNNTGRPEYIVPKREGEKAARRLERMLRIVLAPTKADPYFRRVPATTRRPPEYWVPVRDGRSTNRFVKSVDVG